MADSPFLGTSDEQPAPRSVFAWCSSSHVQLHSPLARWLRDREGIETILFVTARDQLPNTNLFDFNERDFLRIIEIDPLMRVPAEETSPNLGELTLQATALERQYGFRLLDILRADRHMGIGFVTGARFMRTRAFRSISHTQGLIVTVRLCRFFEALLKEYRPLAIVSGAGAIGPAALTLMAQCMNVPVRMLIPSRQGHNMHWAINWDRSLHGFEAAYQARLIARDLSGEASGSSERGEPKPTLVASPHHSQRDVSGISKLGSLKKLATEVIPRVAKIVRMNLGDRVHGRSTTQKYLLRDALWHQVERWYWFHRTLREHNDLSTIPQVLPFIYFPFQTEPEADLMSYGQMCSDQLNLLDSLAKNAPAGWGIVVKEHPSAHGPRPKGFWHRVCAYPNVRVLATFERTSDIIARAQAVATINGTAGIEAALTGTPVIAFHPKNITLAMPHVLHAYSYESTRAALRAIADDTLPPMATRLRTAKAFLAALEDCSFPVRHPGLLANRRADVPVDSQDVAMIAQTLLASLEGEEPAAYEHIDREPTGVIHHSS